MRQQVEEAEQSLYARRTARNDRSGMASNGSLSEDLQSEEINSLFIIWGGRALQ